MTKTIIIIDEKPSLEDLQQMVGGYIEVVQLTANGYQFICDEEGKLKGKPINREATWLCMGEYPTKFVGDVLVGDIVILKQDAMLT